MQRIDDGRCSRSEIPRDKKWEERKKTVGQEFGNRGLKKNCHSSPVKQTDSLYQHTPQNDSRSRVKSIRATGQLRHS